MIKLSSLLPTILGLFIALGATASSGSEEKSKSDLLPHVKQGEELKGLKTHQYKHLLFSAQPSKEQLKTAQESGVEVIINMRAVSENPFDEKAYAESLGMRYYQVAILKDGSIDPAAALELEKIHKKESGKKQLLHCSSGNRAAAWFATHIALEYGLNSKDAIEVSSGLGLTKEDMKKTTVRYIEGK